jgi:hypothetical protein
MQLHGYKVTHTLALGPSSDSVAGAAAAAAAELAELAEPPLAPAACSAAICAAASLSFLRLARLVAPAVGSAAALLLPPLVGESIRLTTFAAPAAGRLQHRRQAVVSAAQ